MVIKEDYVSFETAKLLKEKGLYRASDKYYNKKGRLSTFEPDFLEEEWWPAYTLQMAMKWLREKEWVICVIPLTFYCGGNVSSWGYNIWADDNLEVDEENTPKFTTYEQACEAAIKYCLENLI